MRIFIAINLNDEIRNYLIEMIQALKTGAISGNFTHRENLHLTLAFLGELGADKVGLVKQAINRIDKGPFLLSFSGFGRFRRSGGDIHWAGVNKSRELLDIQSQLVSELRKAGFVLENREFSPHLTLGREVKLSAAPEDFYGSLKKETREMEVSRISLMKSERIGGKLVYTEIYGRDLI
jgi:2''-5'' RNA ligase